jgi:signal transduction histidine kinase
MGAELRRHDVVLNTEFLTSLEPVVGDRVQLEQVIVNLVTNGIEAMSAITHRPRLLRVGTQLDDDGNALIAVEDSGVGIELSRVDRIFDPLFSTKPEGMGMGLAICRSIVEAHGGRLWASPQLPYGSIFRFTLSSAKREFRSETASQ